MAYARKVVGLLLAVAFSSQVLAAEEPSAQVVMDPLPVYAGQCGMDMTICKPESYETTTVYEVDPVYTTKTEVETSVKVLTTTSTSIFPVVVTVIEGSEGLCQIITTTTVKKPQTISLTATITKVAHSVTGVVTVETSTYYETRKYLSACMLPKPILDPLKPLPGKPEVIIQAAPKK